MTDIIRVTTQSAEETAQLGRAFAACFLEPLVKSGDAAVNQPVVSLYGDVCAGKTVFVRGVNNFFGLPNNFRNSAGDFLKATTSHCYRYRDFGGYFMPFSLFFDEAWASSDKWMTNCELEVRRGVEVSKPGFDLFEHAPLPHLLASDVAGIVVAKGPTEAKCFAYFNAKISGTPNCSSAILDLAERLGSYAEAAKEINWPESQRELVFMLMKEDRQPVRTAFEGFREQVASGAWLANG